MLLCCCCCFFLLDEELNGLDGCDVKYEKVGCFKDRGGSARALSELIFNDRKNIQWENGEWEKYLQRQVLEYNSVHLVTDCTGKFIDFYKMNEKSLALRLISSSLLLRK